MKKLIPLAVLLVLAGCATTPSPEIANIKEADAAGVSGCQYVRDVIGSTTLGIKYAANAKINALEGSGKDGTTHVVWTSVAVTSTGGTSAYGKTYRCNQ